MEQDDHKKSYLFSIIVALFLSACGFHPLYQNTNTFGGGTSVLDDIWIDTIADKPGVYLRNGLIDRFYNNGTPTDPHYILSVSVIENQRGLVFEKDSTVTRAQWVIRADYRILRKDTREVIDSGEFRSVSAFNILSSQYTTLVTEQAAENAALMDLADKITTRVAFVLQNPSKSVIVKLPKAPQNNTSSSALSDPGDGIGLIPGQ